MFANNQNKLEDFTNAIELDPTNSIGYIDRGDYYYELENYQLAIEDYSKAIEIDPTQADYFNNRGICYYKLENYQNAIEDFTKAIEMDPTEADYFNNRGDCYYFNLESSQLAICDFTKAIELDLTNSYSIKNRGFCYYDLKNYTNAIYDFTKAIELDPTNSIVYFNRGNCYGNLENYKLAIEDYSKALELDSTDKDVLQHRAYSYEELGKKEDARLDYEKILFLYLNDEVFCKQIVEINEIKTVDNAENTQVNDFDITQLPVILSVMGFKMNPQNLFGVSFENVSGVYILDFKNNEYYIGQTKKMKNRLKLHEKNYKDILNIYFKPLVESELLPEEDKTIAFFEKNLLRIRNLKQVKFSNLFHHSCQLNWVNDLSFNYLSGTKYDNELVREKFADRFIKLKAKPYFLKFTSLVSVYIKNAIPNYLASEYNYWCITCLPIWLPKENSVSRININAVPVLSISSNDGNSLQVMLMVSILPFIEYLKNNLPFKNFFENIPSLKIDICDAFENAEGDIIRLRFEEKEFINAINNNVILSSIRLFNLRIMNKAGDESKFTRERFHCLDLADYIMQSIDKINEL